MRKTDALPGRHRITSVLHRDGQRKNLLLYGDRDQLGFVVNVEFAHQVEFVRVHRLDADSESCRRLFHGEPLGEQLHHFAFPQSQVTSPQRHPSLVWLDRVVFQFRLDPRTQ